MMKFIKPISVLLNLFLIALILFLLFLELFHTRPYSIDFEKLAQSRIERIMNASPNDVNIVMLGNSITEMAGDWNPRLDRDDVRNSGQGGYTTGQMIWFLDTCVVKAKPSLCFTLGGINDLSLGISIDQIYANYTYILGKLKKAGIRPIVQSTLYQRGNSEGNGNVDELNERLLEFCRVNDIDYIDLNPLLSNENGLMDEYTTDGTHLTESGYGIWSGKLRDYLSHEL